MNELTDDVESMIKWCNALEDTVFDLVDSIGTAWYDIQEYTGLNEDRCHEIASQFQYIALKLRDSNSSTK